MTDRLKVMYMLGALDKTTTHFCIEVIGVVTDISRLKFAENIQRRHTEDASAHAKALENFIDTTSHEVRDVFL